MPRYKDPETMTAEEELRSLLKWAEQTQHENVAAALRRVLAKPPKAQSLRNTSSIVEMFSSIGPTVSS
jgi:hypothetical protein